MKTKKLVDGYDSRYSLQKETVLNDIGCSIAECRRNKSLTQTELGKLIGLKKSQICKIEKSDNLTISTILRVTSAMDVDARISIEPHITEEELPDLMDDVIMTIFEFAHTHNLAPNQAFRYLDDFGGLEHMLLFRNSIKEESLHNTIEDLTCLCRRRGGRI